MPLTDILAVPFIELLHERLPRALSPLELVLMWGFDTPGQTPRHHILGML